MAQKALHPCSEVGCRELVRTSRCARHERERQERKVCQAKPDTRESQRKRGYSRKWEKARSAYLAKHPLCASCAAHGKLTAADVVDHIVPHRGDMGLFWQHDNWQPLCRSCHSRKTARGE